MIFKISKARNKSIATLTISPLIKENGRIKKILSFTLEYELQPKSANVQRKDIPVPIYTNNSVLSSGTWFKFSVDTTGIFKIDRELLQKIGISTSNLNPDNIRIYGNGGNFITTIQWRF